MYTFEFVIRISQSQDPNLASLYKYAWPTLAGKYFQSYSHSQTVYCGRTPLMSRSNSRKRSFCAIKAFVTDLPELSYTGWCKAATFYGEHREYSQGQGLYDSSPPPSPCFLGTNNPVIPATTLLRVLFTECATLFPPDATEFTTCLLPEAIVLITAKLPPLMT